MHPLVLMPCPLRDVRVRGGITAPGGPLTPPSSWEDPSPGLSYCEGDQGGQVEVGPVDGEFHGPCRARGTCLCAYSSITMQLCGQGGNTTCSKDGRECSKVPAERAAVLKNSEGSGLDTWSPG